MNLIVWANNNNITCMHAFYISHMPVIKGVGQGGLIYDIPYTMQTKGVWSMISQIRYNLKGLIYDIPYKMKI